MRIRILATCGILLFGLILFGCSDKSNDKGAGAKEEPASKTEKSEKKKLGDYQVELGGKVIEKDDKFIIEGESNLLPGSRVVGEVWVGDKDMFSDSTELVNEDGTFQIALDHHQYGEADIVVRFDFEGVQEDEIKRHYGEQGEKLEGPFVYKHQPFVQVFKKAEMKVKYNPDEQTDLSFKAPKWDKPADYGDTRIWIEVDDITEDGEFFYLHGKSNLLEGSEIRSSYVSSSDHTTVQPDGSFDLKLDYKYAEDKEFVIQYLPFSQWGEIQEAYGEKGQKLVGDLVETNNVSQFQFIEKRIPWEKTE